MTLSSVLAVSSHSGSCRGKCSLWSISTGLPLLPLESSPVPLPEVPLADVPLLDVLLLDVLLLDVPLLDVPLLDVPLLDVPQPMDPEVPEQESSWRMMSNMPLDKEFASLLFPSPRELACKKNTAKAKLLKSRLTHISCRKLGSRREHAFSQDERSQTRGEASQYKDPAGPRRLTDGYGVEGIATS
ncbi:hypothetical protein EYF80_058470 [Liparis tanakae]|uniref:Uncharacterized protein n=1 Tax=Liparis tanakae TaxID=230148 RepID=A0A4Z2ERA5_9TELE|nr:hypothetical protein EYF80_058470 [Liparis tanakae]